jgi:(R,R)-butanediol dehydrogenase/meso-butanediol dehydrogenase/diacetyl reductase
VCSVSETVAGLITAKGVLEFSTFESPLPPARCVTVDISLCGICGSDIASFRTGHLHSPAVCGHEWVGLVSEVGDAVDDFDTGDRVVIGVPPACGRCGECRRGLAEYCRTVSFVARGRDELAPPHGGFAARITVSAARVVHAHPALRDEEAAQVEPATVAFHGVRRSGIAAGDLVVVQGAGPIGLFAMQFAHAAGAGEVVVVEPAALRRTVATQLGASHAVNPGDAADLVSERTDGVGADVVLECTGVPQLLQNALDLTRAGGTVGLLSFLAQPPTINAATWLAKQMTLVASSMFTHDDLRRSMALLADGRVRALPLHSRTVDLADLEPTLRELASGSADDVKVLVDPRGTA